MKQLVVIMMLLMSSTTFAERYVKQLSCAKANATNTQCIYEVKGQAVDDPNSISNLYAMTNMPYALCSSALCDIQDGKAVCHCKVFGKNAADKPWQHASVGPMDYTKSAPIADADKLTAVTSTFSFADIHKTEGHHSRLCSFEQPTPWANCFGVRCQVKQGENGELNATCLCPLVKTTAFISMGPQSEEQCDLPSNQAWSAATARQGDNDFAVIEDMYKKYF